MTDATPTAAAPLTVVLVHGAFTDGSSWNGVIERLQAQGIAGHRARQSAARHHGRLRLHRQPDQSDPRPGARSSATPTVARSSATRRPTPRTSSVWSSSPPSPRTRARSWGKSTATSKDAILGPALVPLQYPTGQGDETAVEFMVDPAKVHEVFAADLPAAAAAVAGATQRPVAELAFSEPNGKPAWKTLPSWAVVATGDKAAGTDLTRSMAERAGAHDHRGRWLARDHDLPAPGRHRRHPDAPSTPSPDYAGLDGWSGNPATQPPIGAAAMRPPILHNRRRLLGATAAAIAAGGLALAGVAASRSRTPLTGEPLMSDPVRPSRLHPACPVSSDRSCIVWRVIPPSCRSRATCPRSRGPPAG